MSSLSYSACNAHAPYCRLWFVRLHNIFPHYFIKGTIFRKRMALNIKLIMQVFSVKTQLYYLVYQRHVSATVSSHHQAYTKNSEKEINNAVTILVGGLEP